jgi:triosephosphate isomerase
MVLQAGHLIIYLAYTGIITDARGREMKEQVYICDFCERDENHPEVKEMVVVNDKASAAICNKCVILCAKTILENRKKKNQAKEGAEK